MSSIDPMHSGTTSSYPPAWDEETDERLQAFLAGDLSDGVAAFDFDNTLVMGDAGEAVMLEVMARRGNHAEQMMRWYRELLTSAHTGSAYGYISRVFSGHQVAEFTELSQTAFARRGIVFHPAVVGLMATLQQRGVRCMIVSATNVWVVRTLVQVGLDPLLKAMGGRPLDLLDVHGMRLMMRDRGEWVRDEDLRNDDAYLRGDPIRTRSLIVTEVMEEPACTYEGKAAVVRRYVGEHERFLLAAGDSANDEAMLALAEFPLWVTHRFAPRRSDRDLG
jgi:phosphoserine phosphatase